MHFLTTSSYLCRLFIKDGIRVSFWIDEHVLTFYSTIFVIDTFFGVFDMFGVGYGAFVDVIVERDDGPMFGKYAP